MDIPDPLTPLLPIIYRLWQVFRATSCILTLTLNVAICIVCLHFSSFCLSSVADFSNTEARAPPSADYITELIYFSPQNINIKN